MNNEEKELKQLANQIAVLVSTSIPPGDVAIIVYEALDMVHRWRTIEFQELKEDFHAVLDELDENIDWWGIVLERCPTLEHYLVEHWDRTNGMVSS